MAKPAGMNGLNKKQQLFVLAYIKTQNATESAKQAGYSEKTSYSIGQRLLKRVEIKKAIDSVIEPIIEKELVSVEEIIKELKDIGMAEWREFVKVRMDKHGNEMDAELPLKDKIKALQLLGDHAGAWEPKKIEVSGTLKLSSILDAADDDSEETE